jgi:hypothetical protein
VNADGDPELAAEDAAGLVAEIEQAGLHREDRRQEGENYVFGYVPTIGPRSAREDDGEAAAHADDALEDPRHDAGDNPPAAVAGADDDPDATGTEHLLAEQVDDLAPALEPERVTPGTLSEKIAALETAISRSPEAWEPDDTGRGDYSGTEAPPLDWPESTERSDAQTTSGEAEDAADDALHEGQDAPDDTHDEQLVDEEALRALVADIVRAELQGPLGERITRNVRKLVRREIQRALAAQELE